MTYSSIKGTCTWRCATQRVWEYSLLFIFPHVVCLVRVFTWLILRRTLLKIRNDQDQAFQCVWKKRKRCSNANSSNVNVTFPFVGANVPCSWFRQFLSDWLQNTGGGGKAHSAVSSYILSSQFQRWLNGKGCGSLQVVITACPPVVGVLCQYDTRRIIASSANSGHPASITCRPFYHENTQTHAPHSVAVS